MTSRPDKNKSGEQEWILELYVVTEFSTRSVKAITNLRRICEEYMPNRYQLEIIDLSVNPHLAQENYILAVPTLIRRSPLPVKRIIGDLSATEKVLDALGFDAGHYYANQ